MEKKLKKKRLGPHTSTAPLDIQVSGFNVEGNRRYADLLLERLRRVPGAVDLRVHQVFDHPNLEVNVPLLRKRGRMIIIAGRAAKPPLPFGAFYPRDGSILGFAMWSSTNTCSGYSSTNSIVCRS